VAFCGKGDDGGKDLRRLRVVVKGNEDAPLEVLLL
jgi:hypothetical protein